jgi:hypothetical protein
MSNDAVMRALLIADKVRVLAGSRYQFWLPPVTHTHTSVHTQSVIELQAALCFAVARRTAATSSTISCATARSTLSCASSSRHSRSESGSPPCWKLKTPRG